MNVIMDSSDIFMAVAMFIMIPSLLVYAWTAHFKTNAAGPLIALFFNGFSIMQVFGNSQASMSADVVLFPQGDIFFDLGLPSRRQSGSKLVSCKSLQAAQLP